MIRGGKPVPTKLKILRGNPGHRPLKNEIQVEASTPEPPEHLSKVAKAEWKRITKELESIGLLSQIDMAALAAYCYAYGNWAEATESMKTTGLVIETKQGNLIQNPYLGVANRAIDIMMKCLVEFGMTPSSRTRLKDTKKETGKNKWSKLSEVV